MRTYHKDLHADFTCNFCSYLVSARTGISGVVNRNHCPFCLHSRHVDLFTPGDRLCACKGLMSPVGVTLKHTRDKYALRTSGELMLVHRCNACSALSINRIAADDDAIKLLEILQDDPQDHPVLIENCRTSGIRLLGEEHRSLVQSQLFGSAVHPQLEAATL